MEQGSGRLSRSSSAMIELDAIGKRFGTVDAVKSLSLTIAEGELVL